MKRLIIVILLLTVILCDTATAENLETIPTQFLNAENGLAGETVTDIIDDKNGQKWIATSNGVNHYDGVRMVNVPIPKKQAGRNYVYDICADSDGCIFIATGQGIFQLRKNESAFTPILPSIDKAETILACDGKVYVGNRDGLIVTDGKAVERTVSVGASPMSIENGVRKINRDGKGNIWFTSRYAINCYSPRTGRVTTTSLSPLLPQRATLSRLALCGSKIYVGTKNNGLYVYTPATKTIKHVEGIGNVINSLRLTRQGGLAVGTDGSGAYLLSTATDSITASYGTSGKGKYYLPTDVVYCYYKDDDGIDWFGFYRFGMAHTYKNEHLFTTYSHGLFTSEGINVRSFYIHGGVCLLGTANGLTVVDGRRNIVKSFTPHELGGMHIITGITHYNGYYYVASYDCGVRRINTTTLEVSDIPGQPLLKNITIGALALPPDGKLWMGTSEGLFIMDAGGQVIQYTESNSSIIGSSLNSLYFDSSGNGWICGAQGLSYYARRTAVFENNFPKGFFNKEYLIEASRGKGGNVLLTSRSGIWYTDEAMKKFGKIGMPPFLAGNTCHSFLDDMQGNYWMLMDNGLFRMDYKGEQLVCFGYGEGLDCQVINGKLQMDGSGRIWVATSNGLKSIDTRRLAEWQQNNPSKVLLYDVTEGGKPVTFGEEQQVNDRRQIRLPWNFTSQLLTVKAALNDFARPYGRLFEYRLDGEGQWHVMHAGEAIMVRGLLPGLHALEVRLAGVPATMRTYSIMVTPSAVAWMELAMLLAAITLFVLWKRSRKYTRTLLEERNDIETALIEVEAEQQELEVKVEQQKRQLETTGLQGNDGAQLKPEAKAENEKYKGVRMDDRECGEIVARMKKYLEETKRYTGQDMKMSDLAEHLHLSSSKLSMVFNLYMHENYYDFINRYRLEEFKRLIAGGAAARYTIIALSEKCGFKKSNFFSTFRKIEGMTPTEYLKKHNIVMQK